MTEDKAVTLTEAERDKVVAYFLRGSDGSKLVDIVERIVADRVVQVKADYERRLDDYDRRLDHAHEGHLRLQRKVREAEAAVTQARADAYPSDLGEKE